MINGLIADIGGTNVRFALVNEYGETLHIENLLCRDYAGPVEAVQSYYEKTGITSGRPRRAAFCVAAPVNQDRIDVTNNHWDFLQSDVKRKLGLDHLKIVNDFTAVALSTPRLHPQDYVKVGTGKAKEGSITVLGPGTGLGVSGLVYGENKQFIPISGEGGHVALAAVTDRESEVLAQLRKDVGFVSAERGLSGFGMVNLYNAMLTLAGKPREEVDAAEITRRALQEHQTIAVETLDLFCGFLGTVASDMALTLFSTGGVFIAGGIIPKLGEAFALSSFRQHFDDKGIYTELMKTIPTLVITHPHPAFVGLSSMVLNRT